GPQVVFAVTSRRLVADLCDLGVTPRKSLTLRWPQMLPPEFARPYLLGYFDGDGFTTVSRSQAGYAYPRWGLLGTEAFLLRAIEVIGAGTGIRQRRPRSPTNSKIWRLTITGADAERVDEWLHHGP